MPLFKGGKKKNERKEICKLATMKRLIDLWNSQIANTCQQHWNRQSCFLPGHTHSGRHNEITDTIFGMHLRVKRKKRKGTKTKQTRPSVNWDPTPPRLIFFFLNGIFFRFLRTFSLSTGQCFTPLSFELLLCTLGFYCKIKWERSEVRDPNCMWTVNKLHFTSPWKLSKVSPRTRDISADTEVFLSMVGYLRNSHYAHLFLGQGLTKIELK